MLVRTFPLQHFIGFIGSFIMGVTPDVPRDVKVQMHRENELEQQMLFDEGNENAHQNSDTMDKQDDPESTMTAKEIPAFDTNGSSNAHRRYKIFLCYLH